ncbi:DNA mismatch repair protein MutS [Dyadobacter sp. LJ53]|uniref:MutS-related protein n=1 Tax=Dyadobacter chenwenxiniae TaxID=2906456 RepID=UPI001F2B2FA0|nr:DNA mismatch repair protein MutS [Dyadobacter chenwenxiniae]MCF0048601.1 DNA mismatch repair protein MutS [Dyadobacter chenwenxiniae]
MPSKNPPLPENPQPIKTGFFNFAQIEKYFLNEKPEGAFQVIADRTFQDLDLEDVFKFIDRSVSRIGQQYLYYFMRTIPQGDSRKQRLESIIDIFQKDPALKTALAAEISKLSKTDAYYITSLFHEKYTERPSWYWLIKTLSAVSVLAVFSAFFFPKIIIFLIVLLPVNLGIHYWNKNNLYQYGSSIPQLLILIQAAQRILKNKEFADQDIPLRARVNELDQLGLPMSIFKIEARLQGEIGQFVDYVFELFKAMFLIEPVLLFTILKIFDSKRQHIKHIFQFVAETDIALSILSLRESAPCFCQPTISTQKKHLRIQEVFHPLIFNGVANDISLHEKSALLTGSNMSGKTTFIRAVGINAILGQTINTCFAKKFIMSPIKIHSSIRISDDLLGDKSYYFEEVLTLKNMLEESRSGYANLFLLDELFKGTNSVERIAIGKSVLSYLARADNLALASTHDRELSDYLTDTFDLYHFTEIIDGEDVMFDYKLKPGTLRTTNAIRILELNDYPKEIIAEAVKLVDGMKSHGQARSA